MKKLLFLSTALLISTTASVHTKQIEIFNLREQPIVVAAQKGKQTIASEENKKVHVPNSKEIIFEDKQDKATYKVGKQAVEKIAKQNEAIYIGEDRDSPEIGAFSGKPLSEQEIKDIMKDILEANGKLPFAGIKQIHKASGKYYGIGIKKDEYISLIKE